MPPKTKFRACYEQLLAGEHPWDTHAAPSTHAKRNGKANAAPRAQFYMDLLCLPVNLPLVLALFAPLSPTDLLDERHARARENITGLWKEALRVLEEDTHDTSRRTHAYETLLALACAILPKPFANYTLDVIVLLAGRMADADDVFYALVDVVDAGLRAPVTPAPAVQLALVCIAFMGNTSLATYFLHRDLFASAMHVVHTHTSVDVISETALLISLLSTAGQAHGVRSAAGLALDPVSSVVMSHAGFQPYHRKLREHADSVDMARIAHALSMQLARTRAPYRAAAASPTRGDTAWFLGGLWGASGAPAAAPALPPPRALFLLCVWLLVHTSDAFALGMLAPPTGEPLVVHFFSLASYILTYGASSPRATTYAHTVLQIIVAFLGATDGTENTAVRDRLLCDEVQRNQDAVERGMPDPGILGDRVELCRTRAHPLPLPPTDGPKRRRRLVVLVLDNAAIFFKYNRSMHWDAPTFATAFTAVRRTAVLCAQQRVQLEYDWLELWRAMLGVGTFLAQRAPELAPADVQLVAQSLVETLAVALVYSDRFLQTPAETPLLVYEVARNAASLESLAPVLPLATHPGAPPRANVYWAFLQYVLATTDAKIAAWRAQPTPSGFFFARGTTQRVPSPQTILRIVQEIEWSAVLSSDAPRCAAVLNTVAAPSGPARNSRRGAPTAGMPSPSAALLRYTQQDLLAFLQS